METRITVQTYAGYKGDERPVSFSRDGLTFAIREIVDRWYDPDYTCFKVLADDGKIYLLRHDTHADGWELMAARDIETVSHGGEDDHRRTEGDKTARIPD